MRHRDFVLSPYGVIKIKSLGYIVRVEQVRVGSERQAENSLALPLVTKMFLGDRWEYLFRTAGEQFVVRAYGDDGRLEGVCALSLPADKVWIFPAPAHGAL